MSKAAQPRLKDIRSAIRKAAPGSTETVSYFQMPGYSYQEGYDYHGMFAWFSFKAPYVRLHVRPPVLEDNIKHLADYNTTKAIISLPADSTEGLGTEAGEGKHHGNEAEEKSHACSAEFCRPHGKVISTFESDNQRKAGVNRGLVHRMTHECKNCMPQCFLGRGVLDDVHSIRASG